MDRLMKRLMTLGIASMVASLVSTATPALADGNRHCEMKVDGKAKTLDDVKTRKECKKKGGKWVKDHAAGAAAGTAPGSAEGAAEGDGEEDKDDEG
jgi:hypothetical protein